MDVLWVQMPTPGNTTAGHNLWLSVYYKDRLVLSRLLNKEIGLYYVW